MAQKIDPGLQIALGLLLGGAKGFAQRKEKKRQDQREDERFALDKQIAEARISEGKLRAAMLKKEYDDAIAAGKVFTPEERALIEETIAGYRAMGMKADTEMKVKDAAHYDDDRAFERRRGEKSMQYMDAQIGAMHRSGSGSSSYDGGGLSIAQQRALAAMDKRMDVFRNAHYDNGTGEWDSEESYQRYQNMADEYENMLSSLTGIGAGARGGENRFAPAMRDRGMQVDSSGLLQGKTFGAPTMPQKPKYGEGEGFEGYVDDVVSPFRAIADAIGGTMEKGYRGLFGPINGYETASGQPFDAHNMTSEQIDQALREGRIRPRKQQPMVFAPGTYGY